MTPERTLLGLLALAVAYLGFEFRRISMEADEDRDLWYDAFQKWERSA